MSTPSTQRVLSIIVFAQFCGTALWFAGNVALAHLEQINRWPGGSFGHLTTAVQFGFIVGTLLVTITGLADRISPSRLFLISCVSGAVCNSILLIDLSSFNLALTSRILTGICLGGIYPIGMKIAADWRKEGLGDWLGALVGALVLGTALPHALRFFHLLNQAVPLLIAVSLIACIGGVVLFVLVPDGPYQKRSSRFSAKALRKIFSSRAFRSPALGYFGHMWELYAFWAFVPWILSRYFSGDLTTNVPVSITAFSIIAVGGFGCYVGGKISLRSGSIIVAKSALFVSAVCCLLSPLIWEFSTVSFMLFMLVWGFAVVTDSPQFSAMVAANAPAENRGTALTSVTCIGFAITILSIQLLIYLEPLISHRYLLILLAPGPILGLWAMRKKLSL